MVRSRFRDMARLLSWVSDRPVLFLVVVVAVTVLEEVDAGPISLSSLLNSVRLISSMGWNRILAIREPKKSKFRN